MFYTKYALLILIVVLTSFYFTYERRRVKQYMHLFLPFIYIVLVNLVFFTDIPFLIFGSIVVGYHALMIWGCDRGIGNLSGGSGYDPDMNEDKVSKIQQGLDYAVRNRQRVLYAMILILLLAIVTIFFLKY